MSLAFVGIKQFAFNQNIHIVENKGQTPFILRTAQLKGQNFKSQVKKNKIDLVLNLRGESEDPVFIKEKEISSEMGLAYYALGFSVKRTPDIERFNKILDILDKAKSDNKRLMIHCRAGADRTGFISAISQIYLYGFSVDEALESSLKLSYNHMPAPEGLLETVLSEYKNYEKEMDFRTWVNTKYDRDELLEQVK